MQTTSCKTCQHNIPKASLHCPHCGAERSHQECYPEQYQHPLVGKQVRSDTGQEGVVERVIHSPHFGPIAFLEGNAVEGFPLHKLTEINSHGHERPL